jgi:hypothetical protein
MTLSITINPNLRSPRQLALFARRFCMSLPATEANLTGQATRYACLPGLFRSRGAAMKNPNLKKPNAQFGAPTPQGFL